MCTPALALPVVSAARFTLRTSRGGKGGGGGGGKGDGGGKVGGGGRGQGNAGGWPSSSGNSKQGSVPAAAGIQTPGGGTFKTLKGKRTVRRRPAPMNGGIKTKTKTKTKKQKEKMATKCHKTLLLTSPAGVPGRSNNSSK